MPPTPAPAAAPAAWPTAQNFLAFGIPSLDELLGRQAPDPAGDQPPVPGYDVSRSTADSSGMKRGEAATICVIGPDGTGKSLFALHLTSDYRSRTGEYAGAGGPPKVVYASTDLSVNLAEKMWDSFWLDRPRLRRKRLPFRPPAENAVPAGEPLSASDRAEYARPHAGGPAPRRPTRLALRPYSPHDSAPAAPARPEPSFAGALSGDGRPCEVMFIDLEANTAGDDWGFLHTLLAALDTPPENAPRHLLVIDAVEGLETLVGERDAFGERQSRRSRVAQIVRAAAGKCHLVFIVEEPKDGERLPEVFVSDVVVRLRTTVDRDYARRTVELEKVRGQPHVRGEHDFRIRQRASRTGDQVNPDEPQVGLIGRFTPDLSARSPGGAEVADFMSYIEVFPSLHHLNHRLQIRRPADVGPAPLPEDALWRYAWFGIFQLDAMLKKARSLPPPTRDRMPEWCAGSDQLGVPMGSVTCLVGNESTYKSQLSRSFLSQAFRVRDAGNDPTFRNLNRDDPLGLLGQGVAVLLAAQGTDRSALVEQLACHVHVPNWDDDKNPDRLTLQSQGLADRVLVRRLDIHHQPSTYLMHVVKSLVELAKRKLFDRLKGTDKVSALRGDGKWRPHTGRIRFVIDDLSTIEATYPEVARDPLFLPCLTTYLRDEGVTTLILATQRGRPLDPAGGLTSADRHDLVTLSDFRLFTWHVSFFDEKRVAITAMPGTSPLSGQVVRDLRPARKSELPRMRLSELERDAAGDYKFPAPSPAPALAPNRERAAADRHDAYDDEALVVDPHFELYAGLEEGRPRTVPLNVRLYAERDDIPAFQGYLYGVRNLFRQMFGHTDEQAANVLQPQYGASYDILRELSYLQSEAKLGHTLVLQVDEFWAETRSELTRQERYLDAWTVDQFEPNRFEDPFGLFQRTDEMDARWRQRRQMRGQERAARGRPNRVVRRHEFFDLIGCDYNACRQVYPIHKVPYTWDFGMLVLDETVWKRAFGEKDHRTVKFVWKADDPDSESGKWVPVQQELELIWDRLWKISDEPYRELFRETSTGVEPNAPKKRPPLAVPDPDPKRTPARRGVRPGPDPFVIKNWRNETDGLKAHQFARFDMPKGPIPTRHGDYHLGEPEHPEEKVQHDPLSWREFFGACKTIAKATRYEYQPFDVDMLAVESFSCLVFEVWMSEVFQACYTVLRLDDWYRRKEAAGGAPSVRPHQAEGWKAKVELARQLLPRHPDDRNRAPTGPDELLPYLPALSNASGDSDDDPAPASPRPLRHQAPSWSLMRLLDDKGDPGGPAAVIQQVYRRALYRTALLLDEVLPPAVFNEGEFVYQARAAGAKSVAARHWYSTATIALATPDTRRGKLVAGLPGHFSVRGDWYLAIARGSRSPRLGEQAIDILSSRRANITRLQTGLGLPVRDLFTPANPSAPRGEHWTSLKYIRPDDGREERIPYRELRKLGAYDPKDGMGRRGNFFWFWRSTVHAYDTQSRIWQRWLCQLMTEWRRWPKPDAPAGNGVSATAGEPWWDGFKEYDHYYGMELNDPAAGVCHVDRSADPPDGGSAEPVERWRLFDAMCDRFVETLKRATLSPERPTVPPERGG